MCRTSDTFGRIRNGGGVAWIDDVTVALDSGQGDPFRHIAAVCHGGSYALFQIKGGSLHFVAGGGVNRGRYDLLEKDTDAWDSLFRDGVVKVVLDGEVVWVGVDRLPSPGYLIVADLKHDGEDVGDLLRFALVSDLTAPSDSEEGRLPLWLRPLLEDAARVSSPLLVISEEGSGKDLFVSSLIGKRAAGRRIEYFHPGRLSEAVQLRELFGESAGARLGGVGAAIPLLQRGPDVVVIREAGALSMQVQLRLHALLEQSDIFWIFETSRDLKAMAVEGGFIPSLYGRLEKNRIVLPPVRSCRADLPAEVKRILGGLESRYRRRVALSDEAMEAIVHYDWPGNYDELKSVLESTFLLCTGEIIEAPDLRIVPYEPADDWGDLNLRKRIEEAERGLIMKAFALHAGNQVHMARALGISRGSLQYKMQKYGLMG
jgi:hypothetical protein